MIDRTVEAIVLDWDAAAVPGENRWVARLRSRVHALCAAGVSVGVASAVHLGHLDAQLRARPNGPGRLWLCPNGGAELFEVFPDGPRLIRRRVARIGSDAAKDAGLAAPRVTTDGNTTEIGLTSKSDSLRDIIGLLDTRGAGPGLVLAIGDALHHGSDASRVITLSTPPSVGTAGSGFAELLALLDEQLRRRRMRRTPGADEDPEWIIQESGRDPMRHRITETLFTVGAAGFATRGALEEPAQGSVPLVLAAGTYCSNGPDQHLLPGPVWTGLDVDPALAEDTRLLDLRTGVLVRQERACGAPPLRTLRFASVTVPGVVALRAEAAAGRLRPGAPFRPSSGSGAAMTTGRLGTRQWARAGADSAAGIRTAAHTMVNEVGADSLKIYEGKLLTDIGKMRNEDPYDAAFDILVGDRGRTSAIYFSFNEDALRYVMKQPWVSVGQDAGAVSPDSTGKWRERGHPRGFGTFPRILGRYVRQDSVITLEFAVRKMTSLAAQRVGINDRGLLKPGMYADITVFDPNTIIDRSTYEMPSQLATGVSYVLVNGVPVVDNGQVTGALPGRALRGPGYWLRR